MPLNSNLHLGSCTAKGLLPEPRCLQHNRGEGRQAQLRRPPGNKARVAGLISGKGPSNQVDMLQLNGEMAQPAPFTCTYNLCIHYSRLDQMKKKAIRKI